MVNRIVRNTASCFAIVLMTSILSSCSTGNSVYRAYTGEPLPPEKVATAMGESTVNFLGENLGVNITKIDGKDTSSFFGDLPGIVEITPGYHVITVNYSDGKVVSKSDIHLRFKAEAGHRYLIKGNSRGMKWRPTIYDMVFSDKKVDTGGPKNTATYLPVRSELLSTGELFLNLPSETLSEKENTPQ